MGKTIISADGRFEWDEEKAEINLRKHGLAFNEILPVFDDPNTCFTERNGRIRIFSVRKARPREEERYYERFKTIIP
jgi:uncharacterized DUF497 family protein